MEMTFHYSYFRRSGSLPERIAHRRPSGATAAGYTIAYTADVASAGFSGKVSSGLIPRCRVICPQRRRLLLSEPSWRAMKNFSFALEHLEGRSLMSAAMPTGMGMIADAGALHAQTAAATHSPLSSAFNIAGTF